ncbi:hypothetical protein ACJX0J_036696, partial [Zea mays]
KQLVAIGLFRFVLHETCSSPSSSLPPSKLCSTTYGKELDKVTGQKRRGVINYDTSLCLVYPYISTLKCLLIHLNKASHIYSPQ